MVISEQRQHGDVKLLNIIIKIIIIIITHTNGFELMLLLSTNQIFSRNNNYLSLSHALCVLVISPNHEAGPTIWKC